MISYVSQVCREVDGIGPELEHYVAFCSFMAEQNDCNEDALAHGSKVGNRNRNLERAGYNLKLLPAI